ncbi:dicarboxylate/amino acid:cation symporter [Clostridium botulinum]|uniref:Integral membrane transport protein n=1 Tax=Clostridium botulinum (strain Hall / ATCC 3502 / NCTC 13319 / Type A) TaxID=441771 RepID=A5I6Z5_CLOBH|nr:dicarboxylate/amino acid:cation symporter [Clostridium botulinum]ABS34466.1 sodium:dicarboxylate symporter family protein [Clostridium botulinum A str. ATCC 19397]ABS38757.1 sodium:dicarboxylate symporter family protein [Clostridium botulinum A str. Hall]AWB19078.1 dicarboxylate/amino acid:cation symporter [Clostridium botulinum]AWB31891.1 dicarboxylate/amino acid:cation symporter [Clostridium botulinum]EGT5615722.1 dicarboxylate/amino acid:cation symporter [Clostridium botulinum]
MKRLGLLTKLVLGIIFGILIGMISKTLGMYHVVRALNTFSGLFGGFLNFCIPLIIVGFVAPGIADLGKGSGKLLGITVLFAYLSTIIGGMAAFLLGQSILPRLIKNSGNMFKSKVYLEPFFKIDIPPIMGVMSALVLAFVLGICIPYIKGKNLLEVTKDFKGIVEIIVKNVIIPLVPIHIAGIFSKLTASGEIVQTLKTFSSVYLIIIPLQIAYIVLQYFVAYAVSRKSPIKAIKNMIPGYMMALGTQSSAASIPVNLQCAKKNDLSDDVVDFVIPLCATIHLAGDTITLVLGAMGIMLMSGQAPTAALMIPYIFMLGVTMVAAPGIPGGGVYATLGLLKDMLMFNPAQQGLMIAIHFAQDSFGTATNVCGDGAIAIVVDKLFRKKSISEEKMIKEEVFGEVI